jgi:hypothetical protein
MSSEGGKQFLVGPEPFGNFHVECVGAAEGNLDLVQPTLAMRGFDHEKSFSQGNHRHRDIPAACS